MTMAMNEAAATADADIYPQLYDSRIRPELQQLEARRQPALWIFVAAEVAVMALVVGEFALKLDIRILLATLVGLSVLGYIPLGRLHAQARTAVITALCGPMGVSFR